MAVINVKSPTDLSGFYVVYNGSVQNEKKGWYGLSHLMEHLMYHRFDDLLDDFDKDGISSNAYTSDNNIVFYMTGLDEYLNKQFQCQDCKKRFDKSDMIIPELCNTCGPKLTVGKTEIKPTICKTCGFRSYYPQGSGHCANCEDWYPDLDKIMDKIMDKELINNVRHG